MNKTTDNEKTSLNSNEELVLSKISLEGVNSQREISSRSGLSVGMINILIKNLVQKGYVKLSRLNKKNIRYLLTTKGITEQINLTRLYIQDTFDRLANYKKCVTDLVQAKINDNNKQFIIIGENELANIVELVLKDIDQISYARIPSGEKLSASNMILLDCSNDLIHKEMYRSNNEHYINITRYISERVR